MAGQALLFIPLQDLAEAIGQVETVPHFMLALGKDRAAGVKAIADIKGAVPDTSFYPEGHFGGVGQFQHQHLPVSAV